MKKLILVFTLILSVFLASPLMVAAETSSTDSAKESVCQGVGLTSGQGCDGAADTNVQSTIQTVINILSWIVGIVAVVMVIIGGLKYVTSAGDSNSINSAKNTILYAVIGLVVVLLAQVMVRFVVKTVDKAPTDTGKTSLSAPLEASKMYMV